MSTAPHLSNLDSLLERLLHELHLMQPLLPTYIHLIVSAIFPIYIAAHASLARPVSAAPTVKNRRTESTEDDNEDDDDDDDDEIEETSPKIETLTPSDALLFPVMAGGTLATLYFVLKFFKDPAWLNWFLGIYFAAIGFFFMMRFFQDTFSIIRSACLPRQYSYKGKIWQASSKNGCYRVIDSSGQQVQRKSALPGLLSLLPLPTRINTRLWSLRRFLYAKARLEISARNLIQMKVPVEALDSLSLALTAIVVIYHTFIDKAWYLTNLLGFSFCYGSLQFMTPGTSWTGSLLLAALFFYDIYFVFFTPMMVTVATKLDVPIKLLFPRPDGCVYPIGAEDGSEAMENYLKCIAKKKTMAMLGLGDIVVPGMMLAFALRFDLYLFYLRKQKQQKQQNKRPSKRDNIQTARGHPALDDQTGLVEQPNESEVSKPAYFPATGYWGERFWVSSKFHTELYQGKKFPKTYFYATIVGYVIGMMTTVMVMQIANHAQPALLYLVPGVLISLWGTALIKGDVKLLWEYSEVPNDERNEEKTEVKKEAQKGEEDNNQQKELENSIQPEKEESKLSQINSSSSSQTQDTNAITESKRATKEGEKKQNDTTKEGEPAKVKSSTTTKKEKFSAPENHLVYFAIIVAAESKTDIRTDSSNTGSRTNSENNNNNNNEQLN